MNIKDEIEVKRKELTDLVNNSKNINDVVKKSEELDQLINNYYNFYYQPVSDMGKTAVELLLKNIEAPDMSPTTITLDTTLSIRDTDKNLL